MHINISYDYFLSMLAVRNIYYNMFYHLFVFIIRTNSLLLLSILLQIDFGDLNTDEVKDLFVSELYDGIELDKEGEEEEEIGFVPRR